MSTKHINEIINSMIDGLLVATTSIKCLVFEFAPFFKGFIHSWMEQYFLL